MLWNCGSFYGIIYSKLKNNEAWDGLRTIVLLVGLTLLRFYDRWESVNIPFSIDKVHSLEFGIVANNGNFISKLI